jgi:molybdopterin/thiamine biosynthesis adenylyltransferase
MSKYHERFKDAPWFIKSQEEKIVVVGNGGIGSNALYCLTKTIPAQYYIIDHDTVMEHNVGTQFFWPKQIGMYKVEACKNLCEYPGSKPIITMHKEFSDEYMPIMISALDNMKARREVFDVWKTKEDRQILIEARLRSSLYEVYVVIPGREEEYEKTLFSDSEVDSGPCTFKQTAYFAMLCGARITHVLVNYLINKYAREEICNLPFRIQEVGECMYFESV